MKGLIGIGLIGMMLAGTAVAQPVAAEVGTWYQEGVAAYRSGDLAVAQERLGEVWALRPTYRSPADGAVAYWLGAAWEAAGLPDRALTLWRNALLALDAEDAFDVRTADAFVRRVFAEHRRDDYALAGQAYLRLLAEAGRAGGTDALLVAEHLRELAIILPEDLRRATGLLEVPETGPIEVAPGAGPRLVTWWRSQDVAPATRNNERLEEHLERVAYARAHYRHEGVFDDRGRVYIRLGPPTRTTHVQFDRTRLRNKVIDRSLTLHRSDFPENEFWFYHNIDDVAQFVFHKTQDTYTLGEVRDLLPPMLRTGLGPTARGKAKARAAVRTLEEIYRQLSLYHPAYADRYQDVAAFVGLLDDEEVAAQTASQMQAVRQNQQQIDPTLDPDLQQAMAASLQPNLTEVGLPGGSFPPNRPDLFAQSILNTGHVVDEMNAVNREAWVPRVYTNTFDEVEELPAFLRTARFLDPDGTTRTEIYWAPADAALYPGRRSRKKLDRSGFFEPYDFLLVASIVQKTADYVERAVHHHRHLIREVEERRAGWTPQVYVVRGDTGRYHLALQWDQYGAEVAPDGAVAVGPWVKAVTFRVDSLEALRNDGRTLEMSDLRPLLAPEDGEDTPGTPYPYTRITPALPLALYFEVYHLAFGPDERAHFTVAYEIARQSEAGGLLRFDGPDEARTTVRAAYTSPHRTARETIFLDLSQWQGSGPLAVRVRVTDETTGQSVERVLRFDLVP